MMYNLENESAPIKLFTSLFVTTLSLEDYSNDYDEVTKYNGNIVGSGWVDLSNIDHTGESQTRGSDYDKGHVVVLASQIEADGLSRLPYVEWDQELENFVVLSGHHRIKAMKKIAEAKGQEQILIPVCVLKFKGFFNKKFWLQRENKHEAAKGHCKNDAIKFIIDLREGNYKNWNTRKDMDNIKNEVYSALTDAGYTYNGRYKKEIYCSAWDDIARDTVRTIAAADATQLAKAIFNGPMNTWSIDRSASDSTLISQTYCITTSQDASRKCLHIAGEELAASMYKTRRSIYEAPLSKVKAFIYFPGAYKTFSDFNEQRKQFITQQEINNRIYFSSVNMIVSEIVFPPQFKGKKKSQTEEEYIKYVWNFQSKKFELKC